MASPADSPSPTPPAPETTPAPASRDRSSWAGALAAALARLLGLYRDRMTAALFGADALNDALQTALTLIQAARAAAVGGAASGGTPRTYVAGAFGALAAGAIVLVAVLRGGDWFGGGRPQAVAIGVAALLGVALVAALAFFAARGEDRKSPAASPAGPVSDRWLAAGCAACLPLSALLAQLGAWALGEEGSATVTGYGFRLAAAPWALAALFAAPAGWGGGAASGAAREATWAELRRTLHWVAPVATVTAVLATDWARFCLGMGSYWAGDGELIRQTGSAVLCFALALACGTLSQVLARGLRAAGSGRTAIAAAALGLAVQTALGAGLSRVPAWQAAAWPAGATAGALVQLLWLTFASARGASAAAVRRFAVCAGLPLAVAAISSVTSVHLQGRFERSQYEYLQTFVVMGAIALAPPWLAGSWAFSWSLRPLRREARAPAEPYLLGVPAAEWPDGLTLAHACFTTAWTAGVVGFFAWTIRDTLPPEGHNLALTFQRAVAPAAASLVVYVFAAEGAASREYAEWKAALAAKWRGEEPFALGPAHRAPE